MNPQEAIVGKWQLVGAGPNENEIKPVEIPDPDGYLEFLSDGRRRSYYSKTEEYYYLGTYKIDSKFLYYDYDKTYDQGRFDYKYSFSKNQLKITYIQGLIPYSLGYPRVYIYQRTKKKP